MLRPDQPRFGADRPRIGKRVTIARQQQVIAVIDGQVGRGVEIGTATAAGLLGGLVDMDLETGIGQPDGRRQARNSGADDVCGLLHQIKA